MRRISIPIVISVLLFIAMPVFSCLDYDRETGDPIPDYDRRTEDEVCRDYDKETGEPIPDYDRRTEDEACREIFFKPALE